WRFHHASLIVKQKRPQIKNPARIASAGFFMLRKILTPWFIFSCLCSTQLSRFEFTALQFSLLQMLQCPACDGAVNGYIRTEIEDIDLADVISAQARIFR